MVAYWTRIVGAWLFLKFASSLMKDAESLLRETTRATPSAMEDPLPPKIVEAEVVQ